MGSLCVVVVDISCRRSPGPKRGKITSSINSNIQLSRHLLLSISLRHRIPTCECSVMDRHVRCERRENSFCQGFPSLALPGSSGPVPRSRGLLVCSGQPTRACDYDLTALHLCILYLLIISVKPTIE